MSDGTGISLAHWVCTRWDIEYAIQNNSNVTTMWNTRRTNTVRCTHQTKYNSRVQHAYEEWDEKCNKWQKQIHAFELWDRDQYNTIAKSEDQIAVQTRDTANVIAFQFYHQEMRRLILSLFLILSLRIGATSDPEQDHESNIPNTHARITKRRLVDACLSTTQCGNQQ